MKIESSDQDVRTLLSSAYYKIPRFQRPYSWDRENVQEFWDDVIKSSEDDYFIGSMVVYKDAHQHFGIVDGQQRLTTITILLCAVRNAFRDNDLFNLAEGVQSLIERNNIDNQQEFVLTTETSYPYFQERIQSKTGSNVPLEPQKEEENIGRAYTQLESLVHDAVNAVKRDSTITEAKKKNSIKAKLTTIRDSILDLKLITVTLENQDDAYIIFETLNTRGKDLSTTDLVKNHLAKHLKSKSVSIDQAKLKWTKVLEIIQGSSIELETDTFLHHCWLSKHEYLTTKGLFKAVKKNITKTKARGYLDDLVVDASIYRSIHETSYGKWSKQESRIEDALQALMLFRVRQQTPCVLSLVREYRGKNLSKKQLEDALVAVEKFHFLFTAITSQRSSGGISMMYASLGRRLGKSSDKQGRAVVIAALKSKLKERVPKIDEVLALFSELICTDRLSKDRKLMRYVLTKFDRSERSGIAIDYSKMTIEHILPQSAIDTTGITDELVGQCGNLILVTEEVNKELRDKPFSVKKNILLKHNYKLSPEMIGAETWGEEQIVSRTATMAKAAYESIWKI